ncbi:MAG: rhamnogalacturonan acetylesterase [Bacteroidales bacterium]|nr:rhamnogalacturonan acetylesterase [Bacteroidales bacterium]
MRFLHFLLLISPLILSACSSSVITIRTIGDSTMADYEENTTETRGWGEMFGHFVNPRKANVVDYARGGRSSKSFYEEKLWQTVLDSTRKGDYILIQFAHNDEKNNGLEGDDGRGTAPWGQYRQYLERYIDEAREKGATPIFVAPIIRRYFDSNGRITRKGQHDLSSSIEDTTKNYILVMKTVAKQKNVPYVDLTSRTLQMTESAGPKLSKQLIYVSGDNTHTRAFGAAHIAKAAMNEMRDMKLIGNVWKDCRLVVNPQIIDLGNIYTGNAVEYTFDALAVNGETTDRHIYDITTNDNVGIRFSGDTESTTHLYTDTIGGVSFIASFTPTTPGPVEKNIIVSTPGAHENITIKANVIEPAERLPMSVTFSDIASKPADEHFCHASAPTLSGLKLSADGSSVITENEEWPADIDESGSRYIELYIIPQSTTTITDISLKTDSDLCYRIAASRGKGFFPRTTLFECFTPGHSESVSAHTSMTVTPNERIVIRIYPWSRERTSKLFTIKDITIKGISYK